MKPLELGAAIRLDKVYFKRASPELLPESYPELDRLAISMQAMPGLEIEVHGHTDNIGDETVLMKLSEARAAMVRTYLMKRGIKPERMKSKGFGANVPVASNEDPATRALTEGWNSSS